VEADAGRSRRGAASPRTTSSGAGLDAARWRPARLPLPTGGEHIPLDPNASLAVGEGEVRVTIARFSLSHDTFQPAESASTSCSRPASSSWRRIAPRRSPST
jgi:hypothetical protein